MSAPGSPRAESIDGTKPRSGSKIDRQRMPEPKVSTAQGTSTVARRTALPLNAWCMAMANAMPSTSSMLTEKIVNTNVFLKASQNSLELSASV